MKTLIVICCIVLIFVYMFIRNDLVFDARMKIISEISQKGKNDYAPLDNYSYDKMMWQLLKFKWVLTEDGKIN